MPVLRVGDTARCERTVAERLAALPQSPFHVAIGLNITNPPADVAAHFDGFFRQEAARFKIGAAYTEMNGFDINPGRWFFDVFAFTEYGGQDDYDWISDWQSESYEHMTITGLERLQEVYAGPAFRDKRFKDASYVAGLLVVTKFQNLIRRAAPLMRELHFPLLATAHGYDFIFELDETVRRLTTRSLAMPSDAIESVLKRGAESGIDSLSALERKVWLISEAEVLCDMEGIDSFLDRYASLLPEAADAFAAIGATQIADSLRAIHAELPTRSDEQLDRANALVTARTGYDYDSVSRLVSGASFE